MGKPSVVMATTKFLDLTNRMAANFGLPVRIVVTEHPLGGTDEATIERWADAAVDEVVALFTKGF